MNKQVVMGMVAGMVAAGALQADQITLNTGAFTSGPGGEFTAVPDASLSYLLNYYAPVAKVGGGFETFCLEYRESFTPGRTMAASIGSAAYYNGNGTVDPISIGTAWLYSQFSSGTLAGYNWSGAARRSSAAKLQDAFWYLEGDIGLPQNNPFLTSLENKFGSLAEAKKDNNGFYSVGVLHLTTVDRYGRVVQQNQDQLVRVPDGGATLGLLGFGLIGCAAIRRRRHNSAN